MIEKKESDGKDSERALGYEKPCADGEDGHGKN